MSDDTKPPFDPNIEPEEAEVDGSSVPSAEGMSPATAKIVIDRRLRKKLMQEYDLVEVVNKGRYYAAKALGKDGLWFYELLIDKQTGSIQVVNQKKMSPKSDG